MSDFPPIGAFGVSESGEVYVSSTRTGDDTIYGLIDRTVCPGRYLSSVMNQVENLTSNKVSSNKNSLIGRSSAPTSDKRFLEPMIRL